MDALDGLRAEVERALDVVTLRKLTARLDAAERCGGVGVVAYEIAVELRELAGGYARRAGAVVDAADVAPVPADQIRDRLAEITILIDRSDGADAERIAHRLRDLARGCANIA